MSETKRRGLPLQRSRPRRFTPLAVLCLLLVVAGISIVHLSPRFGVSASERTGIVSGELIEAAEQVFAGESCPTTFEATRALRSVLDRLGYSDWSVDRENGVRPDGCVSGSIDAGTHRLILTPALSAEVRSAVQVVRDNSYDRCLTERDATDMLTTTLTALGQADFEVRVDGPLSAPMDRWDEIEHHIRAGCWVYSGTGLSADGQRIFYLVGEH